MLASLWCVCVYDMYVRLLLLLLSMLGVDRLGGGGVLCRHFATSGTIPPELGRLKFLKYLALFDNELTGTVILSPIDLLDSFEWYKII